MTRRKLGGTLKDLEIPADTSLFEHIINNAISVRDHSPHAYHLHLVSNDTRNSIVFKLEIPSRILTEIDRGTPVETVLFKVVLLMNSPETMLSIGNGKSIYTMTPKDFKKEISTQVGIFVTTSIVARHPICPAVLDEVMPEHEAGILLLDNLIKIASTQEAEVRELNNIKTICNENTKINIGIICMNYVEGDLLGSVSSEHDNRENSLINISLSLILCVLYCNIILCDLHYSNCFKNGQLIDFGSRIVSIEDYNFVNTHQRSVITSLNRKDLSEYNIIQLFKIYHDVVHKFESLLNSYTPKNERAGLTPIIERNSMQVITEILRCCEKSEYMSRLRKDYNLLLSLGDIEKKKNLFVKYLNSGLLFGKTYCPAINVRMQCERVVMPSQFTNRPPTTLVEFFRNRLTTTNYTLGGKTRRKKHKSKLKKTRK